ncbi:MAG: antitoxin family protein [Proteobacteria bacterium]|nr:antitoxin family protein [Pseudomonadota bacterium]
MAHAITAIFEKGVFIPQTKVDLPEHATVKVVIPDTLSKVSKTNLKGSLKALDIHLSAEDFESVRRSIGSTFPRDIS